MLAVPADLAGAAEFARLGRVLGHLEMRFVEERGHLGCPGFTQRRPARAETAGLRAFINRIGLEKFGGVDPEAIARGLDAAARLGCPVGQAHDPFARVLLVIARFLDRLARDRRDLGVRRVGEAFPEQLEKRRHHDIAQHREREVALAARIAG